MTDTAPRPTSDDDREGWRAYWAAQDTPWRTEPEIDEERQWYLSERRAVQPDIHRGIYPFKDENGSIRLSRADVEWLLATHESEGMRGPVVWDEMKQRQRIGLDLRGADLRSVNLRILPLARTRFGLLSREAIPASRDEKYAAAAHLEYADFYEAHLEQASFNRSYLAEADLRGAHLEEADFFAAHLETASLGRSYWKGANFQHAFFGVGATLDNTVPGDHQYGVWLRDVRWNGANIANVRWMEMKMLGDEYEAHQGTMSDGTEKNKSARVLEYERAVRANRQLAATMRDQGLSEEADRFAYHAQLSQRRLLRLQRHYLRAFGSWLLDLVSGYGYRPLRSFITYLVVVLAFAAAYFLLRDNVHPALSPVDAIIFSITSFHGRGFSPRESVALHNPLTIFAAIEAIIGLLIEITFIATFTQRFEVYPKRWTACPSFDVNEARGVMHYEATPWTWAGVW